MATAVRRKKSNLDLAGAVIPRSNLSRANLTAANFERTNLSGADLSMSILAEARLKKAVLQSANLAHADLSEADLTDADLTGANLSSAKLIDANLARTKLNKANLRGANLRDSKNLDWYQLLHAFVDTTTIFPKSLTEEQFFDEIDRTTTNVQNTWRFEYSGRLLDFIKLMNDTIERTGSDKPILEFLSDVDFFKVSRTTSQ